MWVSIPQPCCISVSPAGAEHPQHHQELLPACCYAPCTEEAAPTPPSPRYAVSAARADFPSFSFCTPFKAPDHVGSMRAFQLCCAAPDAFANSHHAAQPRHAALSHGLWKRSATRAAMPSSTKEVLTTVQRGRFV